MKDLLKKEQLFGFIRHGLTILGGALVTKGYIDEDMSSEAVGIIMAIAGLVWSIKSKIGSGEAK